MGLSIIFTIATLVPYTDLSSIKVQWQTVTAS